jgi:predicted membrane channel-forming protein YqfA (hemolysin III family)
MLIMSLNEKETELKLLYICLIVVGLLALVAIISFLVNYKKYSLLSKIFILLSFASFIIAMVLKKYDNIDFNLYHGLWHIFTSIAGSLLLLVRLNV